MDNRYRFRRVFLMLWTSNEDIQEYVDNSVQEGLEVSMLVQGEKYVTFEELLEREQEKSHRQREELCREILLVTDDPKAAGTAKKQGVAVLGYRPPEESRGYLVGVDYVAENLAKVDEDYLNLVYMRAHGIPLTIAKTQHTLIREMRVGDLPTMYELYEDRGVREWVGLCMVMRRRKNLPGPISKTCTVFMDTVCGWYLTVRPVSLSAGRASATG